MMSESVAILVGRILRELPPAPASVMVYLAKVGEWRDAAYRIKVRRPDAPAPAGTWFALGCYNDAARTDWLADDVRWMRRAMDRAA